MRINTEKLGWMDAGVLAVWIVGVIGMGLPVMAHAADNANAPEFSVASGFYDVSVTVGINTDTPGASVRFTVDGSTPSPTHGTLGNSVTLTDTTALRAVAFLDGIEPSKVVMHSYIFIEKVIRQGRNAKGIPDGPPVGEHPYGYGTTEMNQSYVNSNLENVRKGLKALPSLMIGIDPENMFDADFGIMPNQIPIRWDRKPDPLGLEWERPISLEMIHPDGTQGFEINCGIHDAGNTGRIAAKKSLNIRFRKKYGPGTLKYPLVPGYSVDRFDRLRLNAEWDSVYAPYFPEWINELQHTTSGESQRGRLVNVYINGAFWGIYGLTEIAKAGLGESHLGGNKDEWITSRGAGTMSNYFTKFTYDYSDPAQFEVAKTKLNMQHFADYVLVTCYVHHGTYYREDRFIQNFTKGIPWHAYIWDADHAIGATINHNTVYALSIRKGYRDLLASTEFRMLLADRARKHLFDGGPLTTSKATASFTRLYNSTLPAMYSEYARWKYTGGAESDWGNRTFSKISSFKSDRLNNFVKYRTNKLLEQMKEAGWYPSLSAPAFNQYGGEVAAGYDLTISGSGGTLYYTLDGSDPRVAYTGAVNSNALSGSSPRHVTINQTTQVKARIKSGTVWSALTESVFTVNQDFSKLRVTELMYHAPDRGDQVIYSGDNFDFIELKNTGTTALDLKGLHFTNGLRKEFHEHTIIAPGEFLVLITAPKRFKEKYPGISYQGIYSGSLSNAGEGIELSKADDAVVFSFTYDDKAPWSLAPDGAGFSLVPTVANPAGDPNDASLWRTSAHLGGSPGTDDPEPAPVVAVIINEVLTHTDLPQKDSIELHNPTNASASIGGWYLTDDNQTPVKFRIPFGTVLAPGAFMTFTEDDFNSDPTNNPVSFGLSSLGEEAYLFSANNDGALTGYSHGFKFDAAKNGVSFGRYTISTGADHYPAQVATSLGAINLGPKIGPVVINELMYHPIDTADEFVELKNITDAAVKLYDRANPQNTWRLSGVSFDFPLNIQIPANGLLLVVGIDPTAFRSKYNVPGTVQIVGPYLGKLSNGGESVSLKAPEGPTVDSLGNPIVPMFVIDKVKYDDGGAWPTAPDGSGPALARKDAAAYGNDPINWEVSANGGTPGTDGVANQAPVAAFSATPTNGTAPLLAQFDASSSSDDSGITSYTWIFGDGNSGLGANVSHTFNSAGDYTVTLTVTDAEGESDSISQTITATAPSTTPGLVTLVARDQFGQDVSGVQIYIRELSTWYPVGTQVQLTTGKSYRFRGKISNVQGPELWVPITETQTEVLVPFWTATLIARDQSGNDVTGSKIRVKNYFEEWFDSNKTVTLPKKYTAQVYGKVSNAVGPRLYFKFTDGMTEVNPSFHTVTLAARDQFGANVGNAQIRVRYNFTEWYVPGNAVTMPLGYTAQVYGKASNVTGPRIYVKFESTLTEIDPDFWTFTVRTRDQFGAIVPDGLAQLRYITGEYFTDGTVLTVPKGDSIQTRSRRKNLYASAYSNVTFTDGVDVFAAKFRSVLFKAVATDGTTPVPGAEIELYSSQIARFGNNTRKGVPVPDTVRVRVYKDGALIADVNPATFDETTDVLVIPTAYEATGGNADPVIDSNPIANPNPAEMDQTVSFHAGATDADNDVLTYTWTFGDGTGSSGTNPSHTYNSTGTFNVNVTVTDGNGGSASASLNVTVNDSVAPLLSVNKVTLKGNVSDNDGIATLKVNGQTVSVQADGSWQKEVTLSNATTNVTIEATDNAGNITSQTVTISK